MPSSRSDRRTTRSSPGTSKGGQPTGSCACGLLLLSGSDRHARCEAPIEVEGEREDRNDDHDDHRNQAFQVSADLDQIGTSFVHVSISRASNAFWTRCVGKSGERTHAAPIAASMDSLESRLLNARRNRSACAQHRVTVCRSHGTILTERSVFAAWSIVT
jgi:hypothetical protein